jgi:hypothetical protein
MPKILKTRKINLFAILTKAAILKIRSNTFLIFSLALKEIITTAKIEKY